MSNFLRASCSGVKNFFPLPNSIFSLGLSAGELAVYAYLMYCEDRKSHKCWPSYKTIGPGRPTRHYRPEQGTVKIDRIRSGLAHDIVNTRSFLVRPQNGEIKLRVILDRFSVEVFVNDGEQAAGAVIYTPQSARTISFEAGGSVIMDVEKYDLIFNKGEEDHAE